MRKQLYRVASSRSFTRFLSIVAVAVVAFVALELLFVQHAFAAGTKCCTKTSTGAFTTNCYCDAALPCNTGFSSTGLSCPLPYTTSSSSGTSGGTINSTISCTDLSGENNVGFNTVSQTKLMDCTVIGTTPNGINDGQGFCRFSLEYTKLGPPPSGLPGLTIGNPQCESLGPDPDNPGSFLSRLTDEASASQVSSGPAAQRLKVQGKLECPQIDPVTALVLNPTLPPFCGGNTACSMPLGITGNTNGVFGATSQLLADQVLKSRAIVEDASATPPTCTGQVRAWEDILTRYCVGRFDGTAVTCEFGQGQSAVKTTVLGTTEVAIPFFPHFSPGSGNSSGPLNLTCNNPPQSADKWSLTIPGNDILDVTQINQATLKVEGVGGVVTCPGPVVNNTLSCDVLACATNPTLASIVAQHRDANGSVVVTVTGSLFSLTDILGEELNNTTGGN